jgi:hypothetical protein
MGPSASPRPQWAVEQDADVHSTSPVAVVGGSRPWSVRAQAAAWASDAMECVLICIFEQLATVICVDDRYDGDGETAYPVSRWRSMEPEAPQKIHLSCPHDAQSLFCVCVFYYSPLQGHAPALRRGRFAHPPHTL